MKYSNRQSTIASTLSKIVKQWQLKFNNSHNKKNLVHQPNKSCFMLLPQQSYPLIHYKYASATTHNGNIIGTSKRIMHPTVHIMKLQ
ncbi:hypothetical protein KFK09_011589 [Dendrobium nobile]|uniref:Uncharacterized protein n=1 Tax=Dendrobium nobile TaxID=94219 RepID=A0A8T3BEY7_DENNO|nr:hypothetical protein KFK09_011589 [Dendrobium nobile]